MFTSAIDHIKELLGLDALRAEPFEPASVNLNDDSRFIVEAYSQAVGEIEDLLDDVDVLKQEAGVLLSWNVFLLGVLALIGFYWLLTHAH